MPVPQDKLVQLGARSWPGRTAIHENGADACDRAVTGGDRTGSNHVCHVPAGDPKQQAEKLIDASW